MKKNRFIIFGIVFLFSTILFLGNNFVKAAGENDAIAVRIIPNPEHYSINKWYEKQGFTGSPQALIIDGYRAIRDGRTVYVNSANKKGNSIYTNIYLISYNQESSDKTIDILGQVVKKWKFNIDLEDTTTSYSCSISSQTCSNSADCVSGQICASSGVASSSCQLATTKNCLIDSDCPENFFCDSPKAKIIRDLDRISSSQELSSSLEFYKNLNGVYPKLEAGTYLSQNTVSVWPSWSETFLSELGLKSFTDPINRLGACPGYDPITCWNKDTKQFFNSQTTGVLLPYGSYGFVYKTDTNGSNYDLCSVMETKGLGYTFEPSTSVGSSCITAIGVTSSGVFTNTAPRLIDSYLAGEAGQEFNGSVKVIDDEGNPLTWTFSTSGQAWTNWNLAPVLKGTNNPNLKKIYAAKAGNPGTYRATLNVSDGQGGTLSTTTLIVITNVKPFIEAEDVEFTPSANNNILNYSFYISDHDLVVPSNNQVPFSISKISGSDDFNFTSSSYTFSAAGENRYKIDYRIPVITSTNLLADKESIFKITAWDSYSASSTKDIKLKLKADVPNLNFNCQASERIGYDYSCLLGSTSQNNHRITYSLEAGGILPSGLSINTVSSSAYLSGKTIAEFGEMNDAADKITIKATNEYGASFTKDLPLQVNSYCGDKKKQYPNTEGRGGTYNDGFEDCDYNDGVTGNIASSSVSLQYGCLSGLNWTTTPYPILSNNYCVFKSPLDGGGYCGDGYCQVEVTTLNGLISEDSDSCPADCVSKCVPRCLHKTCGDDGCGGSCAPNNCSEGTICTKGSCCPTSANIQVCADNEHVTYFNGVQVGNGNNWANVEKFAVTVRAGKNVMAIKATDLGVIYGFSATLNQGECKSMTTDDISNWKCIGSTTTAVSLENWNSVDYDDSNWLPATIVGTKGIRQGNYLAYQQIWSPDSLFSDSSVYCRYTFESLVNGATSDQIISPTCQRNCSTSRVCGADGCEGSCGTCLAGSICSNGKCEPSCTPKCDQDYCGSDGCGGTCGCGTNENCISGECISCTGKTSCSGKNCGVDGCNQSCGNCGNDKCSNGECIKK